MICSFTYKYLLSSLEYFLASLCMRASSNSNLYKFYFGKRQRKLYMYDFSVTIFQFTRLYPHFPMLLV